MSDSVNRSQKLDGAIADLLSQAPEIEAAAVVSFDGLPMASALPATMDESRVAAMSAALLSLGERAAEGLGRGGLNQVYIEGDTGTVFLVAADDEAVLVAVAGVGAKVGMMLYEVRRAAETVANVLRLDAAAPAPVYAEPVYAEPTYTEPAFSDMPSTPAEITDPMLQSVAAPAQASSVDAFVKPVSEPVAQEEHVVYPPTSDPGWASHLPNGTAAAATEPPSWS